MDSDILDELNLLEVKVSKVTGYIEIISCNHELTEIETQCNYQVFKNKMEIKNKIINIREKIKNKKTTVSESIDKTSTSKELQTLDILKSARQTIAETEIIAQDTLETLAKQGDQIKNNRDKVQNINNNLNYSNKMINKMSSTWSNFINSFRK
jgi:DNA repair ATPase RecN